MNARLIVCSCAVFLLVGCDVGKSDKSLPIENGFYYGGHSRGFPDRSAWFDLQYQDSTGKRIVVWPNLSTIWGTSLQITNNIVVLVGGVYDDGVKHFRQRLIAFEAPAGPPLDVTDQIFGKWCAASSVAFTNIVKDSIVSLTKTNGAVQINFGVLKRDERGPGSINAYGATITISWHDIETIMQDVKKTGKLKKEKQSGMEYLQKD